MKNLTDLSEIAKNVIKLKFQKFIPNWLESADTQELKGLRLISAVVKHKGLKKFRPGFCKETTSLQQAEENLRKTTMQSFYQREFCINSEKEVKKSNILSFTSFKDLTYSSFLKKEVLVYLIR